MDRIDRNPLDAARAVALGCCLLALSVGAAATDAAGAPASGADLSTEAPVSVPAEPQAENAPPAAGTPAPADHAAAVHDTPIAPPRAAAELAPESSDPADAAPSAQHDAARAAAPAASETATATLPASTAATVPAAERYLEAVRAVEDQGGAYSPELSQHLLGLGLAYQQAGRHAEAVATLNRAAQVTRVNEGLFSAADLPILERLIESYAALGDWEQVDSRYQQMFRIHHRNYGDRDPRLLPALQTLSAWHMRAYIDDIGGEPLNHLLTARNLYESSVQIMQANYGPVDKRIADTLRQRALVDYYLASYVPPSTEGFSFAGEPTEQALVQSHVANSFIAGRDALRRVVDLHSQDGSSTELERSQALAELADWHQLFSRRQTALRLYQEAWTRTAQAGESAPAIQQSVFGQPLALPVLPAEFEASAPAPAAQPAYIAIRFAVSESGRAGDMEIVESSPPAADKHIAQLRRRLLATPFRPRFDNGQPVATPNVAYRYTYTP